MSPAQTCLGALVLLPLLASAAAALLPPGARRIVGTLTALGVVGATVPVVAAVGRAEVVHLALGGYAAPLGIALRADGLSALFLSMTAAVGVVVTGYAAIFPDATGIPPAASGTESPADGHPGFWPLWLGCWAGLNAVFVSGDLFNTYVGLEMVGLTAVALVALGGRESWAAALRYLFVAVLGSLLFLVAVALVASVTGSLDIDLAARVIAGDAATHPVAVLALVLVTVGLALKVALVPMHRWLIPAHAGAPGAVSPLMSALVIKASLFVLLRFWLWVVGPGTAPTLAPEVAAGGSSAVQTALTSMTWLLAGLGVLAILVGSVMAMRQTHLKPLIAYSTVAQAGYWFLFFPILLDPASDTLEDLGVTSLADDAVISAALGGTLALALGHGLAKAAFFLAAGALKNLYGTDEIAALRGCGQDHPMLVMTMGLAAVGLAGLPISLGFTGKWQLATSAVGAGHYWLAVVLVIATLLSATYLIKAISPLLVEAEDDESAVELPQRRLSRIPFLAQLAPFVLGCLTVLTGFLGVWTSRLLQVGAPW